MSARIIFILSLFFGSAPSGASDQWTQQLLLKPGWNAVFIHVNPKVKDPASVFAQMPIESVWTWSNRTSSVQFLVDPDELDWNQPGWQGYRSAPAETSLSNLFAINGGQAYLIKFIGNEPQTLEIQGSASTRRNYWVPDGFNLVGFPDDPNMPTSLSSVLAGSSAHQGQAIFGFDQGSQTWTFINDSSTRFVAPGEAFWVYTQGASNYQGQWSTDIISSDGIDFGKGLNERVLRFENHSSNQQVLSISQFSGANPLPLMYKVFNAVDKVFDWRPLSSHGNLTLAPNGSGSITLAIDRNNFIAPDVGSVLMIEDGAGMRRLISLRAKK